MKALWRSLKQSKTGMIGLAIVLVVVVCAIFAYQLAPCDPLQQDLMNKLHDPAWTATGTPEHLLGTDQLGRDVLSRLLVDAVLMRLVDIQLCFPFTLLALFIAAVLGGSLGNVILIAGITSWVRYARLVRGEILSIKESEYIEAIRAEGGSDARIIFRHILPNVISSVIVIATLEMAKIVLMEASLSFLGYGVPVTIPTWGRMLSEARANMVSNPWQCILPGLCITLTVLGVNLLGDWLRDYLDPKLDV